jgi:hypothetical protein
MKIPVIKKIAENYSLDQLRQAEEDFYEEKTPAIEIDGADDGEKLTHTLAAIFIKEEMEKEGVDLKTALRAYTQKVRDSIS